MGEYAENYTNRATGIFNNNDNKPIDGAYVKALYDELGPRPGSRMFPQKVTVSASPPASPQIGDFWIDISTVLT